MTIAYQSLLTATQENFVEATKVSAARDAATRMSLDVKNFGVFSTATENLNNIESYAALALWAGSVVKVLAQHLKMDEFSVLATALDELAS